MKYAHLPQSIHPDFFASESIRSIPEEEEYSELVLDLSKSSLESIRIPCPEGVAFGTLEGRREELRQAVALVDEDWVQYFDEKSPVYCAFDTGKGNKIVSFCTLDDMGLHQGLRVGGPGCVGTIPEYRSHGIGLEMVRRGSLLLREKGVDLSYIHYTHIGHWYEKLGYEPVLRWNCHGILWEKE